MILLRTDCLVFDTAGGSEPCSAAEAVTKLMGDAAEHIDQELLVNAAAGVVHYFKAELGRESVTMGEFCQALAKVLRSFGLTPALAAPTAPPSHVMETDLRRLAVECGKGFELAFFPRLRQELQNRLDLAPRVLRFTGLRSCVKQLAGAQRWGWRCQQLNDHIVDYLRKCLGKAEQAGECALVVC